MFTIECDLKNVINILETVVGNCLFLLEKDLKYQPITTPDGSLGVFYVKNRLKK